MKKVVKRDGREEEFAKEKIAVSCLKCGVPPNIASAIADNVERKLDFPVRTDDIRNLVLDELDSKSLEYSQNWRIYEKEVKKRD